MALRRPPALKAIIAVDASDDLFHDDVHYIDGLPHLDEYALMIDHLNMLPPAPDFPLDEAALARVDTEPWLISFLGQGQDGPFWRRGSLRPDYARLTVPAFLIGGWYDGYRDSVPRMLAHASAPVKVLIGPWNHTFPHDAVPGPAIEWRADAVRWWDHWLKGTDNGIMAEPPVTVYVRHWHPPDTGLAEIPGRWRREAALPPERTRWERWSCGAAGSLALDPPEPGTRSAALRAVGRGGRRALVGRAHRRPAFGGRVEPHLRLRSRWRRTPRSSARPGWTSTAGRTPPRCTGSPGSATWRQTAPSRWSPGPGGAAPRIRCATRRRRPAALLPLELHVTSWVFPRGHRIRLARQQRHVADDLADPGARPRPRSRLGPGRTAVLLPVVPAAADPAAAPPEPQFAAPQFPAPGPARYPDGVRHWGEILPVRWTAATRRGRHRRGVLAGHVRYRLPVGPRGGRGVPALRGE